MGFEIQEWRRPKSEKVWAQVELSKDCVNCHHYKKILSNSKNCTGTEFSTTKGAKQDMPGGLGRGVLAHTWYQQEIGLDAFLDL